MNQFCIGHLRERVRAPDPEAPRGAVARDRLVGDAAKVNDRQRRRCGLQADGVAVVRAKWRARRAAPSALTTWLGVAAILDERLVEGQSVISSSPP